MDISARAIDNFLKAVGRPMQLSLTLGRFRGRFSKGGRYEEYYNEVVVPHKVSVHQRGLGLAKYAKSYHDFRDRRLIDHDISRLSRDEEGLNDFHHVHHNTYRPEYWFSVDKSGDVRVMPMPYDDILELVAHWLGSEINGRSMEDYLAENLSGYVFHSESAGHLQRILDKYGVETKTEKSNKFFNAKILK